MPDDVKKCKERKDNMTEVIQCPSCGRKVVKGMRLHTEHYNCHMCRILSLDCTQIVQKGICVSCHEPITQGMEHEHTVQHPHTHELMCLPSVPKGATDLHLGKILFGRKTDTMWDMIVN